MKFVVEITKDRTVKMSDKDQYKKYIYSLKPGKYYMNEFTEIDKKIRNLDQNALYWKRNNILSLETGYAETALHAVFMEMAGYCDRLNIYDKVQIFIHTSTKLSVKEFSSLMQQQEILTKWLNEDKEPEAWINLPDNGPEYN